MTTTFNYSIATDFGGDFRARNLDKEIRDSAITIALDGVNASGDAVVVVFKADLVGPDETELAAVVAAHDATEPPAPGVTEGGTPIVALEVRQTDNVPQVAIVGRRGSETIIATHDFSDHTTWYSESDRQTDVELEHEGGSVWHKDGGADGPWVRIREGRILDEEGVSAAQQQENPEDPHGYYVKVEVDGVEKTERTIFETTGGDYTVDYQTGKITALEDWTGATLVEASYSKVAGSGWILKPYANKTLVVEKAEIQFAQNVNFSSAIVMQYLGMAGIFLAGSGQLVSEGGGIPDAMSVPLETTLYKTIDQLVDEAVASFPPIPAMGLDVNRGFAQPKHIFQFYYGAVKTLYSSLGMSVRIGLGDGVEFGGERTTATFYLSSTTDPGVQGALKELLG